MRILVIAAKIHNFFRAQRRLDRLVIKIPGASQSSVYKNRFQQEAESVAPRNVRNVSTSMPITPPMTAMAMLPMAAPRMARAPETAARKPSKLSRASSAPCVPPSPAFGSESCARSYTVGNSTRSDAIL